jgi:uncharacterized membrane-anchored protein YitT (DUF2179 family)
MTATPAGGHAMLRKPTRFDLLDFSLITLGCIALVIGNYFFKFPNRFVFGGVTGISVILAAVTHLSVGTVNLAFNTLFLALGFATLGRKFGIKTIYATVLMTLSYSVLEKIYPMPAPFTNQLMLEFFIAILLTAVGSAILFHCEASGGGTDILAMILKKYTGAEIGVLVLVSDVLIVIAAFFVFDIETALFSSFGLLVKSLVIDNSIARINQAKMVNIICDHPEPICDYILRNLDKGATYFKATGAFSHQDKYVILSVMKNSQEIRLRHFLKEHEPSAFVWVANSSNIFGKGFLKF